MILVHGSHYDSNDGAVEIGGGAFEMDEKNIEYVPVWRVQVWEVKGKRRKDQHLIEAELYETEEEAELKLEEFREEYSEDDGYTVKMEKDFLKIVKEWPTPMNWNIPPQ